MCDMVAKCDVMELKLRLLTRHCVLCGRKKAPVVADFDLFNIQDLLQQHSVYTTLKERKTKQESTVGLAQ